MIINLLLSIILLSVPSYTVKGEHVNPSPIQKEKKGYKAYAKVLKPSEILCLSKNIYFEARGEKKIGKTAVALVTVNRLKQSNKYTSICQVVYQKKYHKCQFSWACDNNKKVNDQYSFNICRNIAKNVLMNYNIIPDITNGATHFHKKNIRTKWSKSLKKTVIIGKHVFYKL
tara:strand:+ start:97 stop:612 length:516 start_codon:yes stop_codon:yes gene_type:complete